MDDQVSVSDALRIILARLDELAPTIEEIKAYLKSINNSLDHMLEIMSRS